MSVCSHMFLLNGRIYLAVHLLSSMADVSFAFAVV